MADSNTQYNRGAQDAANGKLPDPKNTDPAYRQGHQDNSKKK